MNEISPDFVSLDFNSMDYKEVRELQRVADSEYSNKPYAFKYGNFDLVDMIHSFFTQNQKTAEEV